MSAPPPGRIVEPKMKLTSIESIARALNGAGVPFLVVGGLAVVAHGYGRQTQDLADIAELRQLHGELP